MHEFEAGYVGILLLRDHDTVEALHVDRGISGLNIGVFEIIPWLMESVRHNFKDLPKLGANLVLDFVLARRFDR